MKKMATNIQVYFALCYLYLNLIHGKIHWNEEELLMEESKEIFQPGIIVQTKLGKLKGTRVHTKYNINGTVTDSYEIFKGIPYALPPVGSRRFEAPQPAKPWKGVRDAIRHGRACPQDPDVWIKPWWPRGEDCLTLSVYTPYMGNVTGETKPFPVIFFIHGGSYEVGSEKMYDGGVLSLSGVVVVMINYRLGLLGFLSSGNDIVPGNYGLLDQIEALKWTKENIHSFHGDPDNIAIMGQSVGSSSVGLLLVAPLARGLFHRAIMQSGAVLARYSYQSHEQRNITEHFVQVGRVHGCPTDDLLTIRECMKQLPSKMIISSRHKFPINDPVVPEFRPFIDGHVLPNTPDQLLRDSSYWKVPILHGVVADELSQYTFWDTFSEGSDYRFPVVRRITNSLTTTFTDKYGENLMRVIKNRYSKWTPEDDKVVTQYTKIIEDNDFVVPLVVLSEMISKSNPHVYQYYFSAVPDSYHLVDLFYIFGTPYSNKQCCHEVRWFREEDKVISNTMMKLWVDFAKAGHVMVGNEPMPSYNSVTKKYLYIDQEGTSLKSNLRGPTIEFWTQIIPSLATQSNKTITSVSSHFGDKTTLLTVLLGVLAFIMALICVVLFIIMCYNRKTRTIELQHTMV